MDISSFSLPGVSILLIYDFHIHLNLKAVFMIAFILIAQTLLKRASFGESKACFSDMYYIYDSIYLKNIYIYSKLQVFSNFFF